MNDTVATTNVSGGLTLSNTMVAVIIALLLALGAFVLIQNNQLDMAIKMMGVLSDNCNIQAK